MVATVLCVLVVIADVVINFYLLTNPMNTQPKTKNKRSQLLLEAISRAKENLHEQSRTPEQKALIKNKKNLEKSWSEFYNK